MLLAGLAVYGAGNALAALTGGAGELIATRALMGVGAAMVFPATLSIITTVFADRAGRARAIGIWGATTGLAVAVGPIVGGALLEAFSWEATFLLKVPIALTAAGLALALVPTSRDPATPPLDVAGVVLSTLAVALVVVGIIEAPEAGWASGQTLALLGAGLAAGGAFVAWERRTAAPMLDIALFRNPRFSAASASIAVAFFALFGFIFLITQYFQFLQGYGPLETGVRLLPVATSVAVASIVGTRAAVRHGNKLVVGGGLTLLAIAFAWTSNVSADTAYLEIAGQMVALGLGMGFTSAPATESIMGAVSTAKAGVGSGVNDATRELGGTLGVAVIGSVFVSLYADVFEPARGVPAGALAAARESVGGAFGAADGLAAAGAPQAASAVRSLADAGFFDGLQAGCLVAAGVCLAGALFCLTVLPARPKAERLELQPEPAR